MLNQMRAEWLKISRRPMDWLLLLVFLATLLLKLGALFLVIGFHEGSFTGGDAKIQILREAEMAQFRLQLGFPGIFGAILAHINGLGGFCAIILAAGTVGSEYDWGTMRLQLTRQPCRSKYLLAKIFVLFLTLFAGMLLALVFGASFGLLSSTLLNLPNRLQFSDLLLLPVTLFLAFLVLLPYVMATIAFSTLGRSLLAGVVGGMLFLTLDLSAGGTLAFLPKLDKTLNLIYQLLLQPNINTLVILNAQTYGLEPSRISQFNLEKLPSPLHAIFVITFYSLIFAGYAFYGFTKRDVLGPN